MHTSTHQPAAQPVPMFTVDGNPPCTLDEFTDANSDDLDVLEWASTAQVGDVFAAFVECRRVA